MSSGRKNQLTRQIGEHLVVAKLGRLGYIATPFAGNVPHFDLLMANDIGRAIPLQVKAINGPSWQFSIDNFLEIAIINNAQVIKGKKGLPTSNLLCMPIPISPARAAKCESRQWVGLQGCDPPQTDL